MTRTRAKSSSPPPQSTRFFTSITSRHFHATQTPPIAQTSQIRLAAPPIPHSRTPPNPPSSPPHYPLPGAFSGPRPLAPLRCGAPCRIPPRASSGCTAHRGSSHTPTRLRAPRPWGGDVPQSANGTVDHSFRALDAHRGAVVMTKEVGVRDPVLVQEGDGPELLGV
ncbi:hypothetical protein BD779DRAFT_1557374 [Infundibulicybe gibba]|nr:hypothetical protein BD779DRAFT_1557374 [Infundibulicybe gibba]